MVLSTALQIENSRRRRFPCQDIPHGEKISEELTARVPISLPGNQCNAVQ